MRHRFQQQTTLGITPIRNGFIAYTGAGYNKTYTRYQLGQDRLLYL